MLGEIANLLIVVSGFLGPVLGILLADYFVVNRKTLALADLYKTNGIYRFSAGFSVPALVAMIAGVGLVMVGFLAENDLAILYELSWFTGFGASFLVYVLMARKKTPANPSTAE